MIALLVGLIYTLPNFFGEAPAVQVSSGKATLKLDSSMAPRVEQILTGAGLKADFVQFEGTSVKARFAISTASARPRTRSAPRSTRIRRTRATSSRSTS